LKKTKWSLFDDKKKPQSAEVSTAVPVEHNLMTQPSTGGSFEVGNPSTHAFKNLSTNVLENQPSLNHELSHIFEVPATQSLITDVNVAQLPDPAAPAEVVQLKIGAMDHFHHFKDINKNDNQKELKIHTETESKVNAVDFDISNQDHWLDLEADLEADIKRLGAELALDEPEFDLSDFSDKDDEFEGFQPWYPNYFVDWMAANSKSVEADLDIDNLLDSIKDIPCVRGDFVPSNTEESVVNIAKSTENILTSNCCSSRIELKSAMVKPGDCIPKKTKKVSFKLPEPNKQSGHAQCYSTVHSRAMDTKNLDEFDEAPAEDWWDLEADHEADIKRLEAELALEEPETCSSACSDDDESEIEGFEPWYPNYFADLEAAKSKSVGDDSSEKNVRVSVEDIACASCDFVPANTDESLVNIDKCTDTNLRSDCCSSPIKHKNATVKSSGCTRKNSKKVSFKLPESDKHSCHAKCSSAVHPRAIYLPQFDEAPAEDWWDLEADHEADIKRLEAELELEDPEACSSECSDDDESEVEGFKPWYPNYFADLEENHTASIDEEDADDSFFDDNSLKETSSAIDYDSYYEDEQERESDSQEENDMNDDDGFECTHSVDEHDLTDTESEDSEYLLEPEEYKLFQARMDRERFQTRVEWEIEIYCYCPFGNRAVLERQRPTLRRGKCYFCKKIPLYPLEWQCTFLFNSQNVIF
jgi:hypothetical protein